MGKRGYRAAKGGTMLRVRTESVFGGHPKPMCEIQLPLWKDVGLHLEDLERKSLARPEAVKKTAEAVKRIYLAATIDCLPQGSIERKVKTLLTLKRSHEKVSEVDGRTGTVKDQGKWRRRKGNNKSKQKLADVAETIFEVKKGDVPEMERLFYEDQCGPRRMVIGKLDVKETKSRVSLIKKQAATQKRNEKIEEIRQKLKKREEKEKDLLFKKMTWDEVGGKDSAAAEASVDCDYLMQGLDESEGLGGSWDFNQSDYKDNENEVRMGKEDQQGRRKIWSTSGTKRKRFSAEDKQFLGEVLETCDRFDVSSTAASTLFNLHASSSKSDLRVNQSQVAKMKRKVRLAKVDNFRPVNQPEALGFDERKDQSKCEVGVGQKGHKRFEKQKVVFT